VEDKVGLGKNTHKHKYNLLENGVLRMQK